MFVCEYLCVYAIKELPDEPVFKSKCFLHPLKSFLCMHQRCLESGRPKLGRLWPKQSMQSVTQNQQNEFSEEVWNILPFFLTSEYISPSARVFLWLSVQCKMTQLSSHTEPLTLDILLYICVHVSVRSHLEKQWQTKEATSKLQNFTAVVSVIAFRVISLKELHHWNHQSLVLASDLCKL